MAILEWSDSLDVGVGPMNDEHKVLIEIMNRLYERNSDGAPHAELRKIFDELVAYTMKHFADEEAFMDSIGYDGAASHKRIHQDLLNQLQDHHDAFVASRSTLPEELFMFLKLWLSAHIKGIDTKYGRVATS